MANHLLDHTLLLEVCQGFSGERAVDLQSVDEDGDGDEAVRLDILLKLLRGVLVENDGVLGLVLDYTVMEEVSLSVSSAVSIVHASGALFRRAACMEVCVCADAYPFPWTTSSFASCRRSLLVP